MNQRAPYFGTGAGVNWIPTMKDNSLELNLRALREMAQAGIKDIQINFYMQCFFDLDNYDAYLSLADKLGLNVTFLFREVEPMPELSNVYHESLGLMTLEEIEKYSVNFVMPKNGIIAKGGFSGTLDCNDIWFTNPVKGNIVSVKAYAYPMHEQNPFRRMKDISEKVSYDHPPSPRGKIEFKGEQLHSLNGWAYTVLFELKTPRLWVTSPVWDKEYFEKIYQGRHLKVITDKCRFQKHPSIKAISSVCEPTYTWSGGDVVGSLDFREHWEGFLKKEFSGKIASLNRSFKSSYNDFSEIPYIPRIVYNGVNHSHWSGVPGQGMNSNYEIIKTHFKHWLMKLSFERMYQGVKTICGDYPVIVKFNWLNIDTMAKQGSGAYMSAKSPSTDIIAFDMYPLSLGIAGLPALTSHNPVNAKGYQAKDFVPMMTSTAASTVLLAKAYDKPAWMTETACGWHVENEKLISQVTELSFDAMLKMGIDQVHYWVVGPSHHPKGANPYRLFEKHKKDRMRSTGKVLAKLTKKYAGKRFDFPEFDFLLAYPVENVFLFNATDEGNRWVFCRAIMERCHQAGIMAADEVLTPELLPHTKAMVIYDGYYLTDKTKDLIKHYNKPILFLEHVFPTNPILGIQYGKISGKNLSDFYSIQRKSKIRLPNGESVSSSGFALIQAPKKAKVILQEKVQGKTYQPFFQLGNRIIFGYKLENPKDVLKVIQWWRTTLSYRQLQ